MSPIRGACAAAAHARHSNAISFLTRDETRGNSRQEVQFGDRSAGAVRERERIGRHSCRCGPQETGGKTARRYKEKPHRTSPLKTCKALSDAARPSWAGIRRRADWFRPQNGPLLVRSASYSFLTRNARQLPQPVIPRRDYKTVR